MPDELLRPGLWLIPFLPLAGSIVCGILHFATLSMRRRDPDSPGLASLAAWVACFAIGGSLVISAQAFFELATAAEGVPRLISTPWEWIHAGGLEFDIAMVIDPLSAVMALVVSGVGLLIHVYSAGYMKGDPGFAKFFAFMNLFAFAMLMLVLSSSVLGLFIGWEGVGLCSYLLIGFWYQKEGGWPAEAGQKAFVVNRIGDACFLVGTFILIHLFSTLDLATLNLAIFEDPERGPLLGLAALLLFGGACGKSAQIPLFTWLPDAMAGPTPVSALIHAATMVTAGVYLVVRLNPLFAAAPWVLLVVGTVGVLTAFVGGTTALCQRDIKKVLAYSTVSQLGYMFLACGAGAFGAAIFHLVTHAFFKGLLFLGAGSVIHGMHDEQDMHRMGGLKRHMPTTWVTFLCGAAALSGLPLLSGFFSKDEILTMTLMRGGPWFALWAIGILTAAITAYYTWRMVGLTFHGPERFDSKKVHPHESPSVMTLPLIILAVLAVAGGLLNLPAILPLAQGIGQWLDPVTAPGREILFHGHGAPPPHWAEWALLGFGSLLAIFFAWRGFRAYKGGTARDEELQRTRPALTRTLSNAWGVDAAYQARVVHPLRLLAFFISVVIDQLAIDGAVNGVGQAARESGSRLRRIADGSIKSYALWIGTGTALVALFWMWI